ncbi:hypothetical protein PHMEG_00019442 [Phytophthora megakarya]|uniref:Uncharacterized protein n=1 Tax=Phytophthora megakarya TaxID=4795 RepID=A0A225VRV8_9STRA|nr:hypothetical protein PHMEG_00019442 [Phytophthora megakarya]
MFALFSRRSSFPRSSVAVQNTKQHIRTFVLFVVKFDNERKRDGERFWFDLSVEERNLHRNLLPRRARGLTSAISKATFATLLKMERVQRWLIGESPVVNEDKNAVQGIQQKTSFLVPFHRSSRKRADEKVSRTQKAVTFKTQGLSALPAFTPSHKPEEFEDKSHVPVQDRSDTSTCNLHSNSDDDSSLSPCKSDSATQVHEDIVKPKIGSPVKLKHQDCNILLEKMMELHNNKMRRAVSVLRADIEKYIQRNSEMLYSIISNQYETPENNDVVFVRKVLNMLKQQIHDQFDQFEEKRAQDEAANRTLLGKRLHSQT